MDISTESSPNGEEMEKGMKKTGIEEEKTLLAESTLQRGLGWPLSLGTW